eukprot:5463835-Amphidinium_carterae.1
MKYKKRLNCQLLERGREEREHSVHNLSSYGVFPGAREFCSSPNGTNISKRSKMTPFAMHVVSFFARIQ